MKNRWLSFFSLLLTSCFSKPQGTVSYTPPPPPKLNFQTKPLSEGSLWNGNGRFKYIYGDLKARDVGDLITILIVEKTVLKARLKLHSRSLLNCKEEFLPCLVSTKAF